jgi:N-dimethylarginine dimethylaminohydrolase
MKNCNEWGQLKKVIVGIADNARIPEIDISLRTVNYADRKDLSDVIVGNYPQQVIDEANEDLNTFCKFLLDQGIEVVRPNPEMTPDYYFYCPRDSVLIYNETQFAAPMSLKPRRKEYMSMSAYLPNLIKIENYVSDDIYNTDCIENPDSLALKEFHPKFDAANIIRANNDLLYLVSNSGNKKGAEVLQEWMGHSVKVHLLENVYSYMHIDSTVTFLREGLMLLNPSRIKSKDVLPEPFRSWDAIWCPEPVDIGHYPGYCNASTWINMNLFSINPNLVVIEEHQDNLRKELEKYNIDCAMLPMRHARTLGGCFHCVTLDIERNVV